MLYQTPFTSSVRTELLSTLGSVGKKKVICKSGIDGSSSCFSLLLVRDRVQDVPQGWAKTALTCQLELLNMRAIGLFSKGSPTF